MPKLTPTFQPLVLGILAVQTLVVSAQALKPTDQNQFPGVSATPAHDAFPGAAATLTDAAFPGITPSPLGPRSLAAPPSVMDLPYLDPGQMSEADNQLISDLRTQLAQEASRSSFDISDATWHYQQIVCAAFPEYVLLAFTHGSAPEGSSRFVAILPRDRGQINIISAYAHGLLPFLPSWNRPSSFALFNRMLRQERGKSPLSHAPNWLLVGMCYAGISGYPVQVLSTASNPDSTLDLLRLDANRPQLFVEPDQSALVTFSDVSQPTVTANWSLRFNRMGELTAASRDLTHQAASVARKAALKP